MTAAAPTPEDLGWDVGWQAGWDERRGEGGLPQGAVPARVSRLDRGWVTALGTPGAGVGGIRVPTEGSDVAVGDWVAIEPQEPRLLSVLPRRGALARRAPGREAAAHVLAANVDLVLLLHALTTPPNPRRLERELVLAYAAGAEPLVVLTKADLVDDPTPALARVAAWSEGVPVLAVAPPVGSGLADLRAHLLPRRTVALVGASGVGKSTLLNALAGTDLQRTAEVRAHDQKGRHTTTAATLVALPGGALLVDTPGLRSLALWGEGDVLDRAFADVTAAAGQCWFADCRHDTEPDCGVREAVAAGTLAPERVAAWQHLHGELDALRAELRLRQKDDAERAEREQRAGPRSARAHRPSP